MNDAKTFGSEFLCARNRTHTEGRSLDREYMGWIAHTAAMLKASRMESTQLAITFLGGGEVQTLIMNH